MEPHDKNSQEWRDWFVRHHFGGQTAASIKSAAKEELEILREFLIDIIKSKES